MKFSGVLNGVDEQIWDARLDPFLPCSFKPGAMAGKALCKRYLQEGLGMDVNPDKPLVVCVSRLVPRGAWISFGTPSRAPVRRPGRALPCCGSGHSDPPFSQAAETVYKRDRDVKLLIFYSDQLSHLLYAAADFVLVPSMFEPCGLTQMIAMEYGATARRRPARPSRHRVRHGTTHLEAVRRPTRLRVRGRGQLRHRELFEPRAGRVQAQRDLDDQEAPGQHLGGGEGVRAAPWRRP